MNSPLRKPNGILQINYNRILCPQFLLILQGKRKGKFPETTEKVTSGDRKRELQIVWPSKTIEHEKVCARSQLLFLRPGTFFSPLCVVVRKGFESLVRTTFSVEEDELLLNGNSPTMEITI